MIILLPSLASVCWPLVLRLHHCPLTPNALARVCPLCLLLLQTPSMVVPLRESADRATANSLALRLSRLSLSQLLHNNGGVVVRERLVKGDSVRALFGYRKHACLGRVPLDVLCCVISLHEHQIRCYVRNMSVELCSYGLSFVSYLERPTHLTI